MLNTLPKFTIFGVQKVKADPMSCNEGNCLVWRSRPLTIFGRPCAFGSFQKVKVGHLTTLTPRSLSSILASTLLEATSAFTPAVFRPFIFPNLIKKMYQNGLEIKRNSDFIGHRQEIILLIC